MNQKIKAVVFDVGGVLADWQGIVSEFGREIGMESEKFTALFLKYSFDPKRGSDLGYTSTDEFFENITKECGFSEKAREWRKRLVPGFRRIESTFKLVEELKGKFRLALLTNAKIGLWDEWQEGKLRENFKIIVDSSEVHILKPDERIYKILLERLQLPARECLYIDDTKEYIEVADKLGFKTIHFKEPEESVKLIRKILYGTV